MRYEDIDNGGTVQEAEHDLVVLSVGMVAHDECRRLFSGAELAVDETLFIDQPGEQTAPGQTSIPGVFCAGTATGPMDIPTPSCTLAPPQSRRHLTSKNEKESLMENKRKIGVYICHCGGNISDYVDVEAVRKQVEEQYGVTVARTSMFTCSDASQNDMIKDIREQGLDGLVVASCSPKLHQITFRNMAVRAGLNPFQYVQVNIREQCSWAHTDDHEGATCKAANLVGAGIEKVMRREALQPIRVTSVKKVLVIGAGIAGLRAALELADLGVEVFLVEKKLPGRHGRHLERDVPGRQKRGRTDRRAAGRGQETRQHHPVFERGIG